MTDRAILAGLLAALCACAPARAAYFSVSGDEVRLQGSIETGDVERMEALLGERRAAPLRVLRLHSPGGNLREGIRLADLVRKHRLATVVDARSAYCDSACTLLFVAGVRRHYVGAERLAEGSEALYGLGFHLASTRGDRANPSMKSAEGERLMATLYARMGTPRATDLARRAAINTLWRPNGATALRLGVATSLSPP